MVQNEKIDYSKLDISELELWFGKPKAWLILELSNLDIKIYNDSVDEIHYYHKDNTPYFHLNVKTNEVSFNDILTESFQGRFKISDKETSNIFTSTVELLLDTTNVKYVNNYYGDRFEIIDLTNRLRTLEDCCNSLNINYLDFLVSIKNLKLITQSFEKLMIIVESLNQGWTPDWANNNQYKYYPYFMMGDSSGSGFAYNDYYFRDSFSDVASRLCFHSKELAIYAGEQFTDIYKDYMKQ